MSRFKPNHRVTPIYDAAAAWKENCFLADGSALSDGGNLWTITLLGELDQRFVKNLDAGEGDFLSKLKAQLSEGSPGCRQMMAESLWLTLLFPSNIGAAKKRENLLEIWSWSGEELTATRPLLDDSVLEGIGSAGTAYNTHRWRELVFLIGALRDFKARDGSEREQIASDPWAFSGWLSGLPKARHRQLIHILPHLLFPDTFERISSEGDKRLIIAGFGDTPEKEIKKWSTVEIDRALLELRRRLEEEHGADIDFYQEEFEAQWKNQTKNWLLSWNPSKWTWDTLAADRATTISGEKADNRWRCSSSKPREGDRVFLIRTGSPPKGVVADGKVTRAPYEAEHWEKARADAGETTRFVDVAFDSVRDATSDEIVPLEQLQSREPGQEWNPQSSGIEIKAKAARSLERLWKALSPMASGTTTPGDDAGSGDASPKKLAPPLNLILYGPPGTGKTYRLKNDYLPRYQDEAGDRFSLVGTTRANRVIEVFRKALNLAVRWGWITMNPAQGFRRNPEQSRERYLKPEEYTRVFRALDEMPHRMAADAIRMLALTGARRGKVLSLEWADLDLGLGLWNRPAVKSKDRKRKRVTLSNAALALLERLRLEAGHDHVFTTATGRPMQDLKRPWAWLKTHSDLPGLRIHDLRHSFASVLVSGGETLETIGKLLGHTQHQTTLRYAHLMDDPMRRAANRFSAEVVTPDEGQSIETRTISGNQD